MQARRLRSTQNLLSIVFAILLSFSATAQTVKPDLRSITVITEPNATVWIDDMRFGTTDDKGRLRIASVPPGIRSLRVRAQGFSEVRRSLPATAKGDVAVALTRSTDEAELAYQAAEVATTVDRQKAIGEYQRAVTLRANFPAAHLGLARMYAETGDHEKALKAVRTAKRLKPGYAEASAVEARLLKETGEEDKAILMFKRAITEGRGFQPEAYTGLGLLYKDRAEAAGGGGDYDGERTNYAEAAKNLSTAVKQLRERARRDRRHSIARSDLRTSGKILRSDPALRGISTPVSRQQRGRRGRVVYRPDQEADGTAQVDSKSVKMPELSRFCSKRFLDTVVVQQI